jgi:serine phosphatase RsbU (regulator of sigma subunit)
MALLTRMILTGRNLDVPRLENVLKSIIDEDTERQKEIIEEKLNLFIQDEEQRDDITIAGFKLK